SARSTEVPAPLQTGYRGSRSLLKNAGFCLSQHHFYRDRCKRIEGRPGLALRFGEYLSWVTIHRWIGGPSTANVPHNRTSPAVGPARTERPVLPGIAGKCSQSLI